MFVPAVQVSEWHSWLLWEHFVFVSSMRNLFSVECVFIFSSCCRRRGRAKLWWGLWCSLKICSICQTLWHSGRLHNSFHWIPSRSLSHSTDDEQDSFLLLFYKTIGSACFTSDLWRKLVPLVSLDGNSCFSFCLLGQEKITFIYIFFLFVCLFVPLCYSIEDQCGPPC